MDGAEMRLKQNPKMWVKMLQNQQTEDMMQLFDIIADYLLDNDLFFFRERLEAAYEGRNYQGNASAIRNRKGRNDSIFERLSPEFTFEQALQHAMAVKGSSATRNSVHQMLKNWKNQGLATQTNDGRYCKIKG